MDAATKKTIAATLLRAADALEARTVSAVMTLTPPRGKDFRNAKEAEASFLGGDDWIIADVMSRWDGKPADVESLRNAGEKVVNLRFAKLRKVKPVKLSGSAVSAATKSQFERSLNKHIRDWGKTLKGQLSLIEKLKKDIADYALVDGADGDRAKKMSVFIAEMEKDLEAADKAFEKSMSKASTALGYAVKEIAKLKDQGKLTSGDESSFWDSLKDLADEEFLDIKITSVSSLDWKGSVRKLLQENTTTSASVKAAAMNTSVPYVRATVSNPPADDLDDEFACEVELDFKLGGKLLAQLAGKDESDLPQMLAVMKKDPDQALKLLDKGGRVMRELTRLLDDAVKNAVAEMADDEFERGCSVTEWSFADSQSISTATVGKNGFILFSVDVDVLGTWES